MDETQKSQKLLQNSNQAYSAYRSQYRANEEFLMKLFHERWHWKHFWNTLKLSSIFETCTYVRAMHMPWLCLSLTTVVSVMRVSPEEATEQCHIESLNHNGHICRPFFNKIRLKWCWWCAIPCKLTFMSKKIIWLHQQWNKENFPSPLSWCLFITDDFPSQAFPHSWHASGLEMLLKSRAF